MRNMYDLKRFFEMINYLSAEGNVTFDRVQDFYRGRRMLAHKSQSMLNRMNFLKHCMIKEHVN